MALPADLPESYRSPLRIFFRHLVDGTKGDNVTDRRTQAFEAERPHLRAVAYRMLGSVAEAEDVVQEAWLRYRRADTSNVENLRGWLTTVVARDRKSVG